MNQQKVSTLAVQLEADPNFLVLERLSPRREFQSIPANNPQVHTGMVIDTETTGWDHRMDRIKQIGMILFEYSVADGSVIRVIDTLEQTGGQIKVDEIVEKARGVSLVIAHNAKHDRPFLEALSPFFCTVPWACSYAELNWHAAGFDSGKLSFLAHQFGFFFTPHHALNDCEALLEILSRPMPGGYGSSVLKNLLERSAKPERRIWAWHANSLSHELFKRGYAWGPRSKCRYIAVPDSYLEDELDWLWHNIYENRHWSSAIEIEELTPFNRFADRKGRRQSYQLSQRQGVNHAQH